jgi:hypothetical protein
MSSIFLDPDYTTLLTSRKQVLGYYQFGSVYMPTKQAAKNLTIQVEKPIKTCLITSG